MKATRALPEFLCDQLLMLHISHLAPQIWHYSVCSAIRAPCSRGVENSTLIHTRALFKLPTPAYLGLF